jgi:chromosome segregation ATPase
MEALTDSERREKFFNLQLTVQKLEEELRLYRNGTTSQQLLDLVYEKDGEIQGLKTTVEKQKEKLHKISKSSAEVLRECEALHNDKITLTKSVESLEIAGKAHVQEKVQLTKELGESRATVAQLRDIIEDKESTVRRLERKLEDCADDVDKLQSRCASLVAEKTEKTRLLEREQNDKAKQKTMFKGELERAVEFNKQIKETVSQEREKFAELHQKFEASQRESREWKERFEVEKGAHEAFRKESQSLSAALTQRTVALDSEIATIRKELRLHQRESREREDEHHLALSAKDVQIVELSNQLRLEREETIAIAGSAVDADLRIEITKKDEQLQSLERALRKRAAAQAEEKEDLASARRENEGLQARLLHLEAKLARQESYMKSRLLKAKGNSSSSGSGNAGSNEASSTCRGSAPAGDKENVPVYAPAHEGRAPHRQRPS